MTQQTAVEWLIQKLELFNITKEEHYETFRQIELKAKEMEKEQQGYIGIEISDKVLFEQATVAMEEVYGYGCETEIDSYFRGLKWMQSQFKKKQQ